jgi:hypothetical protein
MTRTWRDIQFAEFAAVLVMAGTLAFSLVYANVQTYDPVLTPASGYPDSMSYIGLYKGEIIDNPVHKYRLLVPWLARLMPELPPALFTPGRSFSPEYSIAWAFGLANYLFLLGTCLVFYVFQRLLNLTPIQAIVGIIGYLSLTVVVRSGGLPMVDSGYYFFLSLGCLAIQLGNPWLLALAAGLGVLAKENVLLLLPVALIVPSTWRQRGLLAGGGLVGVLVYAGVRLFDEGGAANSFSLAGFIAQYNTGPLSEEYKLFFSSLIRPNGLINVLLTFGLLWLPALYVVIRHKVPTELHRWLWYPIVVVAGLVVISANNLARHLVSLFPVALPLSVIGLSEWLGLRNSQDR